MFGWIGIVFTFARGVISWASVNHRLIIYGLLFAGLLYSGWWLASAYQAIQEADKDEEFIEWYTGANEIAAKYEVTKQENNLLRRQIQGRIYHAKDPSFGCHVDADGMSIINDTLAHTRKSQK